MNNDGWHNDRHHMDAAGTLQRYHGQHVHDKRMRGRADRHCRVRHDTRSGTLGAGESEHATLNALTGPGRGPFALRPRTPLLLLLLRLFTGPVGLAETLDVGV